MSFRDQRESGQSTVEFILTLVLIMTFILGFTQISLVFGFGNYAHYATFMAARAQLSAGYDPDSQQSRASQILVRMLKRSEGQPGIDRWPGLARAQGGNSQVRGADIGNGAQYVSGNASLSWMQGVRYTFKSRLFLVPLGGDSTTNSVTLTSESWLGREPSFQECLQTMQGVLIDNGC